MSYYDWMDKSLSCPACGWNGCGRDAVAGEVFRDGAEYHCPSCQHKFGFVVFPSHEDNLSDARAGPSDRLASHIATRRAEQFLVTKLREPSQLPALDPRPQSPVWDVVDGPGDDRYVVISHGDTEIWRELSWYENFERFGEVASILQQKYGDALRDLVPTDRSKLDLYGDNLSSPAYVENVRKALCKERN